MAVLVVGICVGAVSLVVLGVLALNLWQRVGRLSYEVGRASERSGVALGELQRVQVQLREQAQRTAS